MNIGCEPLVSVEGNDSRIGGVMWDGAGGSFFGLVSDLRRVAIFHCHLCCVLLPSIIRLNVSLPLLAFLFVIVFWGGGDGGRDGERRRGGG